MNAHRIGPVIVGVDGSANARRAIVMAAEFARATHAELVVVHAVRLTEEVERGRVPAFGHDCEIADAVADWCSVLGDGGFETRIVNGSPSEAINRVARELDASMIVVGRRGAGRRPELLLGSTAHQVVEHGRFPVLVIPPIGHSATVRATAM